MEEQVYYLSDDNDWADMDDLRPEKPVIPEDLLSLVITDEQVDDVEDLGIFTHREGDPTFADSQAVSASPEAFAEWLAAGAKLAKAQERFRDRLEEAATAYRAAVEVAQAQLRLAVQEYKPTEEALKARSRELAATLHAHNEAADQLERDRESQKQAALDAEFGPRSIALYAPDRVNAMKRQERTAKVHLVTCKRQPKAQPIVLRAHEAWTLLTDPESSINRGAMHRETEVKFCSSCRPWKTFQERIADFPHARYTGDRRVPKLGPVLLTEIPDNWHE